MDGLAKIVNAEGMDWTLRIMGCARSIVLLMFAACLTAAVLIQGRWQSGEMTAGRQWWLIGLCYGGIGFCVVAMYLLTRSEGAFSSREEYRRGFRVLTGKDDECDEDSR